MNKPSYYSILPAEVRYDSNLTANAKLLYSEITALTNANGYCYATNGYFANLYGKSKVTISKWVRELAENNYISVEFTYKEGTKEIDNRYITILKGGIKEKLNTLLKKTLKNNNTSNNTTSIIKEKIYKKEIFVKPTISEIKEYCQERSNGIDAENFFAFYEARGWMIGRNKMKNWKMCMITWEKRSNKKDGISQIHKHISTNLKAKELLKKARK
jgi:hypothetical protein